jgi:hypothetical protein
MTDTYSIIDINDLSKVDFTQVGETTSSTIRKSLDNSKFVLKWDQTPTFITDGTIVPLQILTHAECLELMETPEWSKPFE